MRATKSFSVLLALVFLAAPGLAKDAVTIEFDGPVVVARVTPGASTAWFSVAHEYPNVGMKLIPRALILSDEDSDGEVRLTLDRAPSRMSFWMVVDMSSGEHAIASPENGLLLRREQLPPGALHARGEGKTARMLHQYSRMIICVVRPGKGAWFGKLRDGMPGDGDGTVNGRVLASLDTLAPIGDSPSAPDDFLRGDIVAFADPISLTVFDGRIVK